MIKFFLSLFQKKQEQKEIEPIVKNRFKSKYFVEEELLPPGVRFKDLAPYLQNNGLILIDYADRLREVIKKPVIINTYHRGLNRRGAGYRTPELNKAVKGSKTSLHMEFLAIDVYVANISIDKIANIASQLGFTEVIKYKEMNFVHCGLKHLRNKQ